MRLLSRDGLGLDAELHPPAAPGPSGGPAGAVVLVHGITGDLHERGAFVPLAEHLAGDGFAVLRFSFRGHGRSDGAPRSVRLAGEVGDLEAALRYAADHLPGPVSVVAASFGAVPACLLPDDVWSQLHRLVLWYPVLDLRRTFLQPRTGWARAHFGPQGRRSLREHGFVRVNGRFDLDAEMFAELAEHDPPARLRRPGPRVLLVAAGRDSVVPSVITREAASPAPFDAVHSVAGAEHGFPDPAHLTDAVRVTAGWLRAGAVDGPGPGRATTDQVAGEGT